MTQYVQSDSPGRWSAGEAHEPMPSADRVSLIDAHVHLHPCFDAVEFFDCALGNFERAGRRLNLEKAPLGWLLFTETAADDAFARLRDDESVGDGRWQFEATDEDCSLLGRRDDRLRVVVVAGRQIVSAEGIEVLALGTTAAFPDGEPLDVTVAALRRTEALVVLPWGFGKWLGRRGRLVAELLSSDRARGMFLGDNGGRLAHTPRPRLFAEAERRGIAVLPGSDPLPLRGETAKVARYGFVMRADLDVKAPFTSLRQRLIRLDSSPASFGDLERLPTFLHRQFKMQMRKRKR